MDDRGRELHDIDEQLAQLSAAHRQWVQGGEVGRVTPVDALKHIDDLLLRRHALTSQGGEMLHPDDTAQISDWGHAG